MKALEAMDRHARGLNEIRGQVEDTAGQTERSADRLRLPFMAGIPAGQFLTQLGQQTQKHHLATYAGNVAYRSLFAMFPSLVSLLWLLTLLHAHLLLKALLDLTSAALPGTASDVIRQQLSASPSAHPGAGVSLGAIVTLLGALWVGSESFRATTEALNVVYGVDEQRPLWRRYIISAVLSVGATLLLVGSLALAVYAWSLAGKAASASGSGGGMIHVAWLAVAWLILLSVTIIGLEAVYYFAPDVDERFRWVSHGSVVALILWWIFTALFAFYIDHVMNPGRAYGALAGIAVLMIYVYAVAFILLLGAEINRTVAAADTGGSLGRAHFSQRR